VRGEAIEATHWTVIIPPITNAEAQGMSPRPALINTGSLAARLTFGAGGVTQQTRFGWPVNGTTFALMASTFELSVRPFDGVSTYTASGVPVASAFVVPGASPTSHQPLMDMEGNLLGFTQARIPAFARALHVFASDAAWTGTTVAWRDSAGATMALARFAGAGENNVRIPIPTCIGSNNGVMEALITVAGGGTAFSYAWELAFT
jgi:hypothetical protein